MGYAIIFGLTFATMLTLIIVPIVYSFSEEIKVWFKKEIKRRRKNEEDHITINHN